MAEAWEPLAWDSAFFGFPTARILAPKLDQTGLRKVMAALKAAKTELAYWSVDPKDAESNLAAALYGGFLADVRTTYMAASPVPSPDPAKFGVSPICEGEETPALYALAVEAGRHSRFNVDPGFPPNLFRALYVEWLRKSLTGERADAVLAARAMPEAGAPIGLITLQAKAGIGNIGLIAVDAAFRGQGLGTALVRAALEWCAGRGCPIVEVATQGRNLAATRLYESAGFTVSGRSNVWHFRP
jgi:dTDP-4-amino-4,6-dideoxy-D-galactose acyltransferase